MASAVLQMHKQGGLIGTVKTEAHKVMEFRILRGGRRTQSKIIVLDFRRADFGLQRVEAGTGNLGGIQRLFLNMQRCS